MTKVKIKKINIHNFLSFQDEEWDFENTSPLVLIKGENKDTESPLGNTSNGSGKSAWSHALMYALFGQLNGKFHNENIKNDYADTILDGFKMSVTVEVDVAISKNEVRHWQIVRGLQKGKSAVVLQLYHLEDGLWKDISKSSSANTQKFIEENVLFMNFEMYQRLVMLSIEDKYNFFKLNASQKRDFVETLFDTSVYSNMYKMMSDDMKSRNVVLQNLKVNQLKLAKSKELCEDEIAKYKASVNDQIDETKKTPMSFQMERAGEFLRNHTWIVYAYYLGGSFLELSSIYVKNWKTNDDLNYEIYNW
jgi:DNA repair exonuclease SbcCD ATPase subunit